MNAEPNFIAQTEEPMTVFECRAWIEKQVAAGRAAGVSFFRASSRPETHMMLIEGWEKQPDDQGKQRWQIP